MHGFFLYVDKRSFGTWRSTEAREQPPAPQGGVVFVGAGDLEWPPSLALLLGPPLAIAGGFAPLLLCFLGIQGLEVFTSGSRLIVQREEIGVAPCNPKEQQVNSHFAWIYFWVTPLTHFTKNLEVNRVSIGSSWTVPTPNPIDRTRN